MSEGELHPRITLMERIIEHYRQVRGVRGEIDVPEWGLTIWVKPMNLLEKEQLREFGSGPRLLAAYVVHRSLDEHGELIFAPAQLQEFMTRADAAVIGRIVEAMNVFDARTPSAEDVRKNS
ncbi:MAG: hypothetical protein A2V88_00680 [Elusimicrobia bacterium RBG_16_66_12]|nr:MAG: hypothetical protein A2V88_00680 [Elusimicrobia bacterium RBG_16_66_12]